MLYRFGTFEFDSDSGELRKNGRAVALEPQPSKALALLLARAGDAASSPGSSAASGIVSRDELRDAIWGNTHVDVDRGLAYCISQVRTALGDSGDNPRFVQTIPKQGFKFIAPVALNAPDAPHAPHAPVAPVASGSSGPSLGLVLGGLAVFGTLMVALFAYLVWDTSRPSGNRVVIAVSVFDNETGNAEYDRAVAGYSDLVVEHLTKVDPDRIAVIGNAAILRQPRNIRNLKAIADNVKADYVLLGQLQQGETGLRFITHFIRLSDGAHLKANRLEVKDSKLTGLEYAIVEEFDRGVREHILKAASN